MNSVVSLISLVLLTLFSKYGLNYKTDPPPSGTRTVLVRTYYYKQEFGDLNKVLDSSYLYTFDRMGILQTIVKITMNGDSLLSLKNEYDSEGRKVRETEYYTYRWFGNPKGSIKTVINYKYQNDKLISENWYTGKGDPWYRFFYEYDPNGHLIEKYQRNSDGNKINIRTYEYNGLGQLSEYTFTEYENQSSNPTEHSTHKYDGNGNLIEWTRDSILNRQIYKSIFIYNSHLDVVEIRKSKNGELIELFKYNYDSQGRINVETKYEIREMFGELEEIPSMGKIFTYTSY